MVGAVFPMVGADGWRLWLVQFSLWVALTVGAYGWCSIPYGWRLRLALVVGAVFLMVGAYGWRLWLVQFSLWLALTVGVYGWCSLAYGWLLVWVDRVGGEQYLS